MQKIQLCKSAFCYCNSGGDTRRIQTDFRLLMISLRLIRVDCGRRTRSGQEINLMTKCLNHLALTANGGVCFLLLLHFHFPVGHLVYNVVITITCACVNNNKTKSCSITTLDNSPKTIRCRWVAVPVTV